MASQITTMVSFRAPVQAMDALIAAMRTGGIDEMKSIIARHKVTLFHLLFNEPNVIHLAIKEDRYYPIQYLDKKFNLPFDDKYGLGSEAINLAIHNDHRAMLRWIFAQIRKDRDREGKLLDQMDKYLMTACECGHRNIVDEIKREIDLEVDTVIRLNLMRIAATRGHFDLVMDFIEGFPISWRTVIYGPSSSWEPALRQGKTQFIERILKYFRPSICEMIRSCAHFGIDIAMQEGHVELVKTIAKQLGMTKENLPTIMGNVLKEIIKLEDCEFAKWMINFFHFNQNDVHDRDGLSRICESEKSQEFKAWFISKLSE